MKHPLSWLRALLGLLLASSVAVAAFAGVGRSPVYSAAAVQAGLARNPQAWVGRKVLVHGVPATYRMQIRALPASCIYYWPCYEAVLLDAAP